MTASKDLPPVEAETAAPLTSPPAVDPPVTGTSRLVLKNTLFLTLGQALSLPLSVLSTAIVARYLGAAKLGLYYLGTTSMAVGFLLVEWGHAGALPALIAKNRASAGQILGATLAWRLVTSVIAYAGVAAVCHLLGYGADLQVVLALVFVVRVITAVGNACQYVIHGFERTDVAAFRQVLDQVSTLLIEVPLVLLFATLNAALVGNILAMSVGLVFVWRALRKLDIGKLTVDRAALNQVMRVGTPFMLNSVALTLQPYVDVLFLSKFSSAEAIGWNGVARRLVGLLILPAAAMTGALYPTLCRLYTENQSEYRDATRGALRAMTVLVVPAALGCALFPEVGITVYSRDSFGPAESNLRVYALFMALVYFTMPLGISILAAGRQRAWSLVQCVCVITSLALDPLLVPMFHARNGNGGLGVAWAAVVSEILVTLFAIRFTPQGTFDRRFWRSLALAIVAGSVMVGVGILLRPVSSFVAAPVSALVYCAVLWRIGGVDAGLEATIRGFVRRKLERLKGLMRLA